MNELPSNIMFSTFKRDTCYTSNKKSKMHKGMILKGKIFPYLFPFQLISYSNEGPICDLLYFCTKHYITYAIQAIFYNSNRVRIHTDTTKIEKQHTQNNWFTLHKFSFLIQKQHNTTPTLNLFSYMTTYDCLEFFKRNDTFVS